MEICGDFEKERHINMYEIPEFRKQNKNQQKYHYLK